MSLLPALPERGALRLIEEVEAIERRVAEVLPEIDDVDLLEEWRTQAVALAEYLRGKELHGPMLGAQRRVEARIGQLLGEPINEGPATFHRDERLSQIHPATRSDFRLLAHALKDDVLDEEEWRQPRRVAVALAKERLPDREPVVRKEDKQEEEWEFSPGTEAICPYCGGTGRVPVESVGGKTRGESQ